MNNQQRKNFVKFLKQKRVYNSFKRYLRADEKNPRSYFNRIHWASAVVSAFIWENTHQGESFWHRIECDWINYNN